MSAINGVVNELMGLMRLVTGPRAAWPTDRFCPVVDCSEGVKGPVSASRARRLHGGKKARRPLTTSTSRRLMTWFR